MTPPASQGFGCWGSVSTCGTTKTDAAEAHVKSEHFTAMTEKFPPYLVRTPRIISRQIDGDGWDEMGEVTVEG